jgi:uncharacterized protein (DUF1330 family)
LRRSRSIYGREIEERTIIVKFDNMEAAPAHYNSDAHLQTLVALGDGVVRDMEIVERVG